MKMLIIALLILLGIGGYYGYQYWQEQKQKEGQEERQKAEEEEAKRKAEEEAKRKAEEEAKSKAEEVAKSKAEENRPDEESEEEAKRKAEEAAKRKAEEKRLKTEKLKARQEAWQQTEKMTGEEKLQLMSKTVEDRVNEFTVRLLFASEVVITSEIRAILEKDPEERTEKEDKSLKKFRENFISRVILEGKKISMNLKKSPEERSETEKERLETLQKNFEDFLAVLQKDPGERTQTEEGIVADFKMFYDLFFFELRAAFRTSAKDRTKSERKIVASFEPVYEKWRSVVLDDVCDIMPLEVDRSKKLSPEFLRQSEERANVAYPVSDEMLKERYAAEAEEKFPVYHVGDEITVYHQIYGGTFDKVTGKFIRNEAEFVWIGDKKIAKAKLREDIAPRFDPDRIEKLKKQYVEQGILRYHRDKSTFEAKLNEEELRNIRGYLKYDGKWNSPKLTAIQILHDTVYGKPDAPRPSDPLRKRKKSTRTVDTTSPIKGGLLERIRGKKTLIYD